MCIAISTGGFSWTVSPNTPAAWRPRPAILPLLQSNYALAATVVENDARIRTRRVTIPGATGSSTPISPQPAGGGKHGGVLVVHQNRGLNPHIEDIARRLATEGYVAVAVDFLSPLGGTPGGRERRHADVLQARPGANHRQCRRIGEIHPRRLPR